ncbi:hypothetical protein F5884DRAFT_854520 [Xylogone sp. PMI_703]|nr:hypothetical protein F5884DRAFT_854520 [Xylogone sp. PMI_703]
MATSDNTVSSLSQLIDKHSATITEYKNDIVAKNISNKHVWIAYLGVAPMCLELLALCNLTASRKDAAGIRLVGHKKFEYLKENLTLHTCLVQVANRGRKPFETASEEMMTIREHSTSIKDTVVTIFRLLLEKNVDIEVELDVLKDSADTCKKSAETMENALKLWSEYVMELHEAADATEQDSEAQFQNAVSTERAREKEREAVEKLVKAEEERIKAMDKLVTEANDMVKEELKKFPTGNELMKMDIFQGLGNAAVGLLNVGKDILGNRFGDGAAFNNNNNNNSNDNNSNNNKSTTDSANDGDENLKSDPANMHCKLVVGVLDQLYGIVCGKNGVNWDLVTNRESKSGDDGQIDLSGVQGSLERRRGALEKKNNTKTSKVGKILLKALEAADKVVEELGVERTNSRNLSHSWKAPEKDSTKVSKWQEEVKSARKKVRDIEIKTDALISGSRGIKIPGVSEIPSGGGNGKAASQVAIEAHSFRVDTARQIYEANFRSADESRQRALNLQKMMINVKLDQDALANKGESRSKGLLSHIGVMIKQQVRPFSARADKAKNQIKKTEESVSMTDLLILQQYTINIWSGFDQFAEFYLKVHNSQILDGLRLMDEMTIPLPDSDVTAGMKRIMKYREESMGEVAQLIDAETTKYKNTIQKTYTQILQHSKQIIKIPEEDTKLVTDAVGGAEQVVRKDMENRTKALAYFEKLSEERDNDQLRVATDPDTLQKQVEEIEKQKQNVFNDFFGEE